MIAIIINDIPPERSTTFVTVKSAEEARGLIFLWKVILPYEKPYLAGLVEIVQWFDKAIYSSDSLIESIAKDGVYNQRDDVSFMEDFVPQDIVRRFAAKALKIEGFNNETYNQKWREYLLVKLVGG